jgi:exopolysaccharide biosynthesis WecB/TagA/CpsF family protein
MGSCENDCVRMQRHAPIEGPVSSRAPRGARSVAFIAWGAVAGRSAEIAAALGGESRCFFPIAAGRRPPAPVRYVLCAAATALYLLRRRPRVVVVTNPPVPAAWFTSVCAWLLGAAVVLDSHPGGFGAQGDRLSARLQPVHRRLVRRAAGVMVTDEEWCRRVRAWGGRPIVIHEAPTGGSGEPAGATTLRPGRRERLRVLVVGNFGRDEPTAAVMDAARQLGGCDFLVTGDPSKCPPELVSATPSNVEMVGFLDPPRYLAALQGCDAVMTLTTEPTSVMRAAYEAVYAERPVIVSDWPVARTFFPYALHAPNDTFGLVAAVEKLQSDYHHFAGLAGVARREQLARWERQLQDLTRVVERAGARAPGGREHRGVVLDDLDTGEAVRHIVASAGRGRGGRVANVNVDILRQALADASLRQAINACDLVMADGTPIVWAARLQGRPVAERVPASEMIWPLCAEAARQGVGVFLLGGIPGAGARAAARLEARCPGLRIETLCPPLGFDRSDAEMEHVVRALDIAQPGVVFCGFGAPKQERLMAALAPQFPSMWFVACGGTFEMVCGDRPSAPPWMRRSGLEWLHRLRLEPRRLFGRYVVRDLPFVPTLLATSIATGAGWGRGPMLHVRRSNGPDSNRSA